MSEPTKIEYRVKPIVRYAVTRYEEHGDLAQTIQRGEYENAEIAHEVGYALAAADHERLGWPLQDERIQYPRREMLAMDQNEPREVASEDFRVPVDGVLAGAAELKDVALVGVREDGEMYVASTLGTPATMALFDKAKPHIEGLAGR